MKLSVIALALFFAGITAQAGEGLFSRAYTTETVPEGHYELEQLVRNRDGRAYGTYNALDLKSEIEYGVSDKFQEALYINTGWTHAKGAPDDNDTQGDTPRGMDRNRFALQSVAMEFIYRTLSPVTDPIGLAFYFEPQYDFVDIHNGDKIYNGLENEFRILVQKNFLGDQLILVYNLIAEVEFFRYSKARVDNPFQGEFDWNNEIGATYRVASSWYAGLEARNHNEIGNFWSHDHSIYWAGPAIHYGGTHVWGTLGVLRQFYGLPNGKDDNDSFQGNHLFLHSHEKWEFTAKVGFPF